MGQLVFMGFLVIFLGLGLFAADRTPKGSTNTRLGSSHLPLWFVVIDTGIALILSDIWIF